MTVAHFLVRGFFKFIATKEAKTAEIVGIYFLGTIVPRKYRPIIFAVGVVLFCYEKFEQTPNEKVSNCQSLL